ncbi:hypothetical protein [Amycolatopsis sp. NPDC003676]
MAAVGIGDGTARTAVHGLAGHGRQHTGGSARTAVHGLAGHGRQRTDGSTRTG